MTTPREKKAASTIRRLADKLVDEMMYDVARDKRNEPKAQAAGYLAVARLMVARAHELYPAAPRLDIMLKAFNSDLLQTEQKATKSGLTKTASGIILPT